MASGQTIVFLIAFLVSLSCIIAQEESGNNRPINNEPPPYHQSPNGDLQDRAGLFGLPSFGQLFGGFGDSNASNPLSQFFGGSNGSDPFSQLTSAFTQFIPGLGRSNNSDFFNAFLPHGRSQRLDLLPSDLEANNATEDLTPHDRFFFSLFHHFTSSSVSIGCNYTTQAGYSCAGCREQLLCNSNDVGRIRVCPFYAPYCYNGVCGTYVNTTCTNSTG